MRTEDEKDFLLMPPLNEEVTVIPGYNVPIEVRRRIKSEESFRQGDGNCLFRALSFVITGSEDHYGELRQAVLLPLRLDLSSLPPLIYFLFCLRSAI